MSQRLWFEWLTIVLLVAAGAVNLYLGSWHMLPLAFACYGAVIAIAVMRPIVHLQLRAMQAAIERAEQAETLAKIAKQRFEAGKTKIHAALDAGTFDFTPDEPPRETPTRH